MDLIQKHHTARSTSIPTATSPLSVRLFVCLCIVAIICVSNASPLAARQGQQQAAQLAALRITGSKRFTSEQIAPMTGLTIGQRVGRDDFQRAADTLGRLGCFSNVRFSFSSQGTAVQLDIEVADAPMVAAEWDNFPWFSDDEINQAVKSKLALFDGTAPRQGSLVDAINDVLQNLLAARHITGTVQHQLLGSADGDSEIMRFRVEGPSMKIAGMQFTDPLAQQDGHIQERLQDIVGKPYSRYTIEVFNVEQVRPVYWQHANLHVRFGGPQALFSGNPNQSVPDSVLVRDSVEPGPSFTWAGAAWKGNVAISQPVLNALLGFQPGQPADGLKIVAAWDRVRAEYGKEGYLDARIEPVEDFDVSRALATYQVNVSEGPQYHMGDLVLTGVSLAADRRIRAAWTIPKGAVFDRSYYDDFLANGAKEALKGLPVHIDKIGDFLRTEPQTATVDVLLDFH
jgi:outer membrane protein assembly factor BamA